MGSPCDRINRAYPENPLKPRLPLCQITERIGKVENTKKPGKTSDYAGDFASLPGPQAATRLYSSKVTDRRSLQPFTFQPVTLGFCHTRPGCPIWMPTSPKEEPNEAVEGKIMRIRSTWFFEAN
jgi:hypothetical protein